MSCHLLCQRYSYGLSLSDQSELNFVLTPAEGTSGCCSAHCMNVLGKKWFSTPSWLTRAGLITAAGNWAVFMATMDLNPRHIDCTSNQSLVETNLLLWSTVVSLHSLIKA